MDMEHLEYGIIRYGTPLYVFDTDKVMETVAEYYKILDGRAELCFAMKANPFLTEQMAAGAERIEVCSFGEYRICRELGIPADKLLISGVLKKREEIREILDYYRGKCLCTIESPAQFCHIAEWSDANNTKVKVYLRLTSGNQFGMDENMIRNMIRTREKWPFIEICGIHFFSGTQKKKIEKMKEELEYLDRFIESLEEEFDFQISELEYGPGLAVSYFEGQENLTKEHLKELADQVDQMGWNGKVTFEMGRALAADCGYYMTSVKEIKTNKGKNYCIVDGGVHHLNYDGQIRGMYIPSFKMCPEATGQDEKKWTVCGALCTVNDVLMRDVPVRGMKPGNVLIFEKTGAYSAMEGMALFLSHDLPKAAFYSSKMGWKLIRESHPTYQWNMERKEEYGEFNENFE